MSEEKNSDLPGSTPGLPSDSTKPGGPGGLASPTGAATKLHQAASARAKLKEILAALETEEGIAALSSGRTYPPCKN